MDEELTKNQQIDNILEEIEKCMVRYPEGDNKPELDRFYAVALPLCKSQMTLVKEALEKFKNEDE